MILFKNKNKIIIYLLLVINNKKYIDKYIFWNIFIKIIRYNKIILIIWNIKNIIYIINKYNE